MKRPTKISTKNIYSGKKGAYLSKMLSSNKGKKPSLGGRNGIPKAPSRL